MSVSLESIRRRPDPRGDVEPVTPPELAQATRSGLALLRDTAVLILSCLTVALALGFGYVTVRPDRYVATTSILVSGRLANLGADRETIETSGELGVLRAKMLLLTARIARLEAELKGATEIAFPPDLEAESDQAAVEATHEGERLLLASRTEALEQELSNLRQVRDLYAEEAKSLEKQVEYAAVQQGSIDKEVASVRQLVAKKLAPEPRLMDLERTAATTASRTLELETELLRTRQNIKQTEQRMLTVQNERRNEVLIELQEARASLQQLQNERTSAEELLLAAGLASAVDQSKLENQVEIIRSDNIARYVVDTLALDADDEFLTSNLRSTTGLIKSAVGLPPETPQGDRKKAATEVLQEHLSVSRAGKGSRIDVSFASSDPDRAVALANAVAGAYLRMNAASDAIPPAPTGAEAVEGAPPDAGGNSQIIREATLQKAGPSTKGVLVASLALGLLLGTGLAFARELYV